MNLCECGCNEQTAGGQFVPGHDQKLRSRLEASVGGLLQLRDLVTAMEKYVAGGISAEDLTANVRRAFAASRS